MTALVLYGQSRICLSTQWLFYTTHKKALINKRAFSNLKIQLAAIADMYVKDHEEINIEIDRHLRAIRELTTGIPATESLSAHFEIERQGAQLSDAERFFLKKAFKQVASIVHPDKGGNDLQFQQALLAYSTGDYLELTDMYVNLVKYNNLWWRQSPEGLEYVGTEVSRPSVGLQKLRTSLLFKVSQHHVQGNKEAASATMKTVLLTQLSALMFELHNLRSKHHGNKQKSSI